MRPSIFLSHSCKDRDLSPPSELTVEERRLRAERLEFARRIRRALFDRLQDTGRYDVWLDVRGGLRAGQIWREGLHQALGRCAGAVILLSPEALESGWVLKETTILTWRAFLGEDVCVVPLLLGVTTADLAAHGFEPSGVSALQSEIMPSGRSADVDEIVTGIVARFDEKIPEHVEPTPSTWSSTVQRWLAETARLLREDDERYAREMCEILGLDYTDDERLGDRFVAVANELLVAGTDEILDVLNTLAGVRTPDQKAMLRRAVEALWVEAGAANRLPSVAARDRPPRVVAIEADEPVTGRHYVDRAYCGKLRADRIFAPDDHTDGNRDHVLARIRELLEDYLPVEDPDRLAKDVQRNGPAYVVLGPNACRTGVVADLTELYPALTVVALTGRDELRKADLPAGAMRLIPPLGEREREGRRYRCRLGAFA